MRYGEIERLVEVRIFWNSIVNRGARREAEIPWEWFAMEMYG